MKRFLLISLIVVVLLLAGGALAVRQYLRSSRVTQQVTTRLEAIYGGPVRVESVDVGLGSSSVNGFQLFEEGADAQSNAPWLKVGSLVVDVSLWDLVRGEATPRNVTVHDAQFLLRFDSAGNLITRFPAPRAGKEESFDVGMIPEAVVDNSQITFRKAGQPELVAKNVAARITHDARGKLTVEGTADSAELGKLALGGSTEPSSHLVNVTLKTDGKVHVTAALLKRLPFVPAIALAEVRVDEGNTPAELTIRYSLQSGAFHYRLELAPENAIVSVPEIGLTARNATGRIVIEDDLVHLRDAAGKAYGGTVELDADLDFSGAVSKIRFPKIKFKDLNVSELGEEWHIPARALFPKGKLTGTAKLEMTMSTRALSAVAVDSLIGISAANPGVWLPAVTALAALPQREVRANSEGKATITDKDSGSSAEIDMKLAPRGPAPAPTAPKTSYLRNDEGSTFILLAAGLALLQGAPPDADYPDVNQKLGRAGAVVLGGVNNLLRDIVGVGGRFVGGLPQRVELPPAPEPDAKTTYLDLNFKLKNVDLARFVKGLKLTVDVPVDGKVSVNVKASIPTDNVGDFKLYKVKGTAQVTQFVLAGVKLGDLDTNVDYARGVLELSQLNGRLGPLLKGGDPKAGTFGGNAKIPVVPFGDLTADLTFDRLPLSELGSVVDSGIPLGGTFSGRLAVSGPVAKLKDLTTLEGTGKITGQGLSAYGLALDGLSTTVDLKAGVLRLPDLVGKFEGTPIAAAAELRLDGEMPFTARLGVKNWDIASLMKLAAKSKGPPLAIGGSFSTTVDVQGALRPFRVAGSGDATTAGLKVNGFEVSTGQFHWDTDGKRLKLTKLDLGLYGGRATGSAVVPLEADVAGSVNMKLSQLDSKAIVKDLALPFKLTGAVDGQLIATLPAADKGQARTATIDLELSAPKLRLQSIPTEQVHGKLDYKEGVVDYKLEGKSLGGTFEVEGRIPSMAPAQKEPGKGKLRIRGISLMRLAEALGMEETVPLSGRLSLNLDYTHPAGGGWPEGKGRLRIEGLQWQGTDLDTDLSGQLILANRVLRLREVGGEIAQGTFRAAVTYDTAHPERGRFYLALDGVESSEILRPWLGDKVKGPMQARIRGHLGATWRGTADLELARGEVFGLEVTSWRLPAEWHYAPATGRARVEIAESDANVARGRIVSKLNLTYDNSLRLDGNMQFFGVDLQTLLRPFAGQTQLGAGRLSGRFEFAGTDVRSANDLTGTIAASFKQAQALQMPLLSAIAPRVGMGQSTTFQRGLLKATLDRGVLRVQQLALTGGTLMLHADGTVTFDQRVNLNVIAKTSDVGLPTLRLGAIGARIPLVGSIPLGLVKEAADVLANRVISLEVTGTVRSPTIRVRPLRTLGQEALRLFVNPSNMPVPLEP